MELLAYIVLLVIGMFLLIKGSDIFVDTSSAVARRFGISEILIGMTLVCFGTGLPEFCLAFVSGIRGNSEFVIGDVIGSNIFNMCVVLGIISLIHPIKLLTETVRKDMKMSLATGLVFLLLIIDTAFTTLTENVISITDGLVLLIFFTIYMYYNLYSFGGLTAKRRKKREEKLENKETRKKKITKKERQQMLGQVLFALIGIALIYLGSEFTLNAAVKIAKIMKVSDILISSLIIATGTSLPEIVTSIIALKKGKANIAIGNLIGSNMMNMLFTVGITALINPIAIVTKTIWIDALIFVGVCLIVIFNSKFKFVRKGEYEISRTEGILLLVTYAVYLIYIVARG